MDAMQHLLADRPIVFIHMVCALAALAIGSILLARRKGTGAHRTLGWSWVLAMGGATASSAFIDSELPNLAGISPIHLITAMVAVGLPRAVWLARNGRIQAHRRTMRGMYIGGCVVAGLFALMPGRFLGSMLWGSLGALA